MADDKEIRKALVGGFNRSDVTEYIETLAKRLKTCKTENDALNEQCDSLRQSVSQLNSERDLLTEENLAAKKREEALTAELEAAKNELSDLKETILRLTAEAAAPHSELDELKSRLAAAEEKARLYDSARGRIADLELDAGRRAEQLEQAARKRAEEIAARCGEYVASVQVGFLNAGSEIQDAFPMIVNELGKLSDRISLLGAFLSDKSDNFTSCIRELSDGGQLSAGESGVHGI